ncbi:hypothetical protein BTIS_1981 [Bifidobacterium tissieri]|uniref:Membrane associated protein n=1 Tax=Bifidobacterium tissieri TaxID=1630162 RepID=A0A261F8X1_9BIFI|nr:MULTISPECIES: hypothetical protein [Bifidobacterium]OZG55609.1 hypothetical protein BTIS_1981 [Bifidobacterium tissieri]TPF97642.1 hypothetical protein EP30_01495 [Bifidobacterium sp. UTCIF-39]
MTGNKNSNENRSPSSDGSANGSDGVDAAWEEFVSSHQDELHDVERSRTARKFNKAARKAEKQAQLSIDDLKPEAFARAAGPRDFEGRSWLDTDDVLNDDDSSFVPPNPSIGSVRKSTMLFVVLLVIGVITLTASILIPALSAWLGTAGGVMTLIGAAGMFAQHKGHTETRTDMFDDGARV